MKKMEYNKLVENYTHQITDENQNRWKVIETSDLEEICESYHQSKLKNNGDLGDVINWQPCNYKTGEGMPKEYGKYLICRKDGKIHWETWNGSGWAYNGNVIIYWMEVKPPCL